MVKNARGFRKYMSGSSLPQPHIFLSLALHIRKVGVDCRLTTGRKPGGSQCWGCESRGTYWCERLSGNIPH